jgi:hypothetical protein
MKVGMLAGRHGKVRQQPQHKDLATGEGSRQRINKRSVSNESSRQEGKDSRGWLALTRCGMSSSRLSSSLRKECQAGASWPAAEQKHAKISL